MRRMIHVTQDRIDRGYRNRSDRCPVTISILEEISDIYEYSTVISYFNWICIITSKLHIIKTSKKIKKFIDDYDNYREVKPFKFLLQWKKTKG